MSTTTAPAICPDCGNRVKLRPLIKVGEQLACPHCDAELEVVNLDPVELDWAYLEPAEDDDDWDDED